MSSGETTMDHGVIRQWAESRGGRPTRVKGTESRDGSGVLRFDFNEPDEKLEEISWEEFFKTFDDRELALLYQDRTADGHTSRFFKFVHRREGEEGQTGHRATGGQSSKQSEGVADDLRSREYTDAQGNVHHHTRLYQGQHGKE